MESTLSYNKAPLVELIVEIRWPVDTVGIQGGPGFVSGLSPAFDIWFQQLTSALRELGFHNLERLVPHHMPVLAHQALYRFKRIDDHYPVVQFGHGIFTVNVGPPHYESWKVFRPYAEKVIAALVANKPVELELTEFSRASLRYIDAFDADLRNQTANFAFIRDDLGISIGLPSGLLDTALSEDQISPTLSLSMPVADEDHASLAFQVAAGRLRGRQAAETIMDIAYTVDRGIPVSAEGVLSVLDTAYTTIHHWFLTLTSTFQQRMEPVSTGSQQREN